MKRHDPNAFVQAAEYGTGPLIDLLVQKLSDRSKICATSETAEKLAEGHDAKGYPVRGDGKLYLVSIAVLLAVSVSVACLVCVFVLPLIGFNSHSSLLFVHFPQVAQRLLPKYETLLGSKLSYPPHFTKFLEKVGIIWTNKKLMGATVLYNIYDALVAPKRGGFAKDLVDHITTSALKNGFGLKIHATLDENDAADFQRVRDAFAEFGYLKERATTKGSGELERFYTNLKTAAEAKTDPRGRVDFLWELRELQKQAKAKNAMTLMAVKDLYTKRLEARNEYLEEENRKREASYDSLLQMFKRKVASYDALVEKFDQSAKENRDGNGGDAKEDWSKAAAAAGAHAGSNDRGSKRSDGGGETV